MSQINEILDNIKLPQIMKVSQTFDNTKLDDVEGDLNQKLIDKNLKSEILKKTDHTWTMIYVLEQIENKENADKMCRYFFMVFNLSFYVLFNKISDGNY